MKFAAFRKFTKNMLGGRAVAAALAATSLLAATPALADALTFNGLFYPGADTVHIKNTAPALNEYTYSGGLNMKDTTAPWTIGSVTTAKNASFMAWCIDIYDNMQSANYTLVDGDAFVPSSHVPLTSSRILALERLASNDLALVNNAKTSSAFQLAVWEIMAENSGSYGLSTGNFTAFGNSVPGVLTLANSWLANLGTAAPTMELHVWRANIPGSTQDLAVFAPIPEPGSYAMLLAGLTLIGFAARRSMPAAQHRA
jgi:hypothetical protein